MLTIMNTQPLRWLADAALMYYTQRHTGEKLTTAFASLQNISEGLLAGTGTTCNIQGFAMVEIEITSCFDTV